MHCLIFTFYLPVFYLYFHIILIQMKFYSIKIILILNSTHVCNFKPIQRKTVKTKFPGQLFALDSLSRGTKITSFLCILLQIAYRVNELMHVKCLEHCLTQRKCLVKCVLLVTTVVEVEVGSGNRVYIYILQYFLMAAWCYSVTEWNMIS